MQKLNTLLPNLTEVIQPAMNRNQRRNQKSKKPTPLTKDEKLVYIAETLDSTIVTSIFTLVSIFKFDNAKISKFVEEFTKSYDYQQKGWVTKQDLIDIIKSKIGEIDA